MKSLLKGAFHGRRLRFLLIFSIVSMCFLTFASQLEIFAIGVMTNKGPSFFELFAPIQNGTFEKVEELSFSQVQERFQQIDKKGLGIISKKDVDAFLAKKKAEGFVQKIIRHMEGYFPIGESITALAYFLIMVALFKAITLFSYRFSTKVLAIKISAYLRQKYFEHIQTLPLEFYHQHHSGTLSSRAVSDAAQISEALNALLINYLQTPFTVITTMALCFFTSWKLSIVIFLGLPMIVWPIHWISKKVKKISYEIQKNQEHFSSVLLDFLGGIQTVKAFGMEHFSLKKYIEKNEHMSFLEQKNAKYDLASRPIIHTIAMFFLAFTLLFGLYGLKMAVSEVLFFAGLLYVFYEPIKKFAEENSRIQKGMAAAERMLEVMSLKSSIQDEKGAIVLKEVKEGIEFSSVYFAYEKENTISDLSFDVKKGECVAIVGPTGGGKSTVAQLLLRFFEVTAGDIKIDGVSLKMYTQKSLREKIAFVPQKPFLFQDTILENIACGRSYTEKEMEDAIERAHAKEFVERLPLGVKTPLQEGGKNLSGGQQQRLAIARALLKQAPVLIMDEATSALDYLSEDSIRNTLESLKGGVTQIIIAHRLSTIQGADRILYLERGRRVAFGTKEELFKTSSGFKKMWESMQETSKSFSE